MIAARQSASFASLGRVALALAALAGAACFRPNIKDGGFKCADASNPCPEGFRCDQGLCVKHVDGGVGGKGGRGGVGGSAGAGGIGGRGGVGGMAGNPLPCFDAMPSCEPSDAGICDPYCQSGCSDCHEKCSVNTSGQLTCNPPTKPNLVPTLGACGISNVDSPTQADDCAPGHVCIYEECYPRCYRFCRGDQDCDNAPCDRAVTDAGQKVCDVPYADCSPLGSTNNTGCGTGTMACYLSAAHSEKTICDCPFMAGSSGTACKRSRDCNPGLACTYVNSTGKALCLQVCDLTLANNGQDCPTGLLGSCKPYRGASGSGTPHGHYGVCF